MEIVISILGALAAIAVAIISSILTKRNSLALQSRQLQEKYYTSYINALSNLVADNANRRYLAEYSSCRNNLFVIASSKVVQAIQEYEYHTIGKPCIDHDGLLTKVIKAIRDDLQLSSENYPHVGFIKPGK